LKEKGFSIGKSNSPVTPVVLNGTVGEAATLSKDLRENYNIFCSVVIYPVVPKGMIILRLIPTAVHTLEDVAETIAAFEAVKEKLSSGFYKKSALACRLVNKIIKNLPVLLFYKHFDYIERKIKLIINQKLTFIMSRFDEIKDLVLGMESDFDKVLRQEKSSCRYKSKKGNAGS
jgi:hypothetical protein